MDLVLDTIVKLCKVLIGQLECSFSLSHDDVRTIHQILKMSNKIVSSLFLAFDCEDLSLMGVKAERPPTASLQK